MKFCLPAFLFCLTLVSCSPRYTYFTEDLYQKQKWSQEDVKRIQFYTSRDIILTRSVNDDETSIKEGKIRIINGKRVEQVVIKAYTPGVLVMMPEKNRFAVSFESEDDAFLMFGPNPKYYERFALLAQDWEKEQGKVHYKGQLYHVDSNAAYAALMVDLKREGENEVNTKRAEGRTVKG